MKIVIYSENIFLYSATFFSLKRSTILLLLLSSFYCACIIVTVRLAEFKSNPLIEQHFCKRIL